MGTANPNLVAKESPTQCPYCGETHEVYVNESEEVVDLLRREGDIDWAKEYPFSEGYRYHYKKCGRGPQQELRVVVKT